MRIQISADSVEVVNVNLTASVQIDITPLVPEDDGVVTGAAIEVMYMPEPAEVSA